MVKFKSSLLSCIVLLLVTNTMFACTDFILPKSEGEPVVSVRTMDFSSTSMSDFICAPRNFKWQGFTPNGMDGMIWYNKYGFIATDVADSFLTNQIYIDGMNEYGLSAATLWLDDSLSPTPSRKDKAKTISQLNVVSWILGNFTTAEEVRLAFDKDTPDVLVFQMTIAQVPFPAHVVVHDTQNNSIVLEWESATSFRPIITSGADYHYSLTNDTYDAYVDLLKQRPIYTKMVASDPFNPVTGTYDIGGGAVSIPNDSDSMPRWLTGYFLMPNVTPKAPYQCSVPWRVIQALRSMGHNDRFYGESYNKEDENALFSPYAFTEWTIARDHTNKIFYYRCMKNQQVNTLKMEDYSTYMKKGKKLLEIGPLSTWFKEKSSSYSNGINAKKITRPNGGVTLQIPVLSEDELAGKKLEYFLYAKLPDNQTLAWNGEEWKMLDSSDMTFPPFHSGLNRLDMVEAPLNEKIEKSKDAELFIGYGTSFAEMFISARYSKILMAE